MIYDKMPEMDDEETEAMGAGDPDGDVDGN